MFIWSTIAAIADNANKQRKKKKKKKQATYQTISMWYMAYAKHVTMQIVTVQMFRRKGALAHSTFLYPTLLSPWEM